jgi:glycosyltransferase involved in cell wall biosynthesis
VKVSAMILTYNHERFIAEAIEGFLMQRTSVPCELVIIDDCSTDGTRDVIRRYWERCRDRIRVLLNRHNIGPRASIVRAYTACRGDYVAPLDGDDYWVSPDKLQRQADFLDAHPDCAMCFHSVTAVWDDGREEPLVMRPSRIKEVYTLSDLLECNLIQACSPMYRKGLFGEHPMWVYLTPVMDWAHHVLHALHGRIGYIDEPMGVYRQHAGGMYAGQPTTDKLRIAVDMLRHFLCVLPREYWGAIRRSLCLSYCRLAWEYCDRGRHDEARRCMRECVREISPGLPLPIRESLSAVLRAHLPGLHRRCKEILKGANRSAARLAPTPCTRSGRSSAVGNGVEEIRS